MDRKRPVIKEVIMKMDEIVVQLTYNLADTLPRLPVEVEALVVAGGGGNGGCCCC
jgi:hypothetical protein